MTRLPWLVPMRRPSRAWLAATGLGAAMLGSAAGSVPAAWPLAVAGAGALAAALAFRRPAAGTAAACAAVVIAGTGIALGAMPAPAAAADGTLILAYLLALDLAESGAASGGLRQLRSRALVLAVGLAAAVLTALAAAAPVPGSLLLILAGVVCAGSVLLIAAWTR